MCKCTVLAIALSTVCKDRNLNGIEQRYRSTLEKMLREQAEKVVGARL